MHNGEREKKEREGGKEGRESGEMKKDDGLRDEKSDRRVKTKKAAKEKLKNEKNIKETSNKISPQPGS